MGICGRVGWLGVAVLAVGCVAKSSGSGGASPMFDAGFDASFDMDGGPEASPLDSTTPEAAVDSSAHDSGALVDSAAPLDSTAPADSGSEIDSGLDTGTVVMPMEAGGSCETYTCATMDNPDSGLPYSSECQTECNGFQVGCSCTEDLAQSCFCTVGNVAPACLTGSLSDCGDPATCAADLSSDPDNCGRCGHSCGALTCNNGICSPIQLSFGGSPEDYPDDWISDGTYIYLASCYEHVVTKIPVGGVPAAGSPVILSSGQSCPRGIASDGTYAYWLDDATGTVWRTLLSGAGTPAQLGTYGQQWDASGGGALHGIAMDATNLYFAVQPMDGYGFVYSMPKTGGTPTVLTNDTLVLRSTIYVDGNNVYFMGWDNNGSYVESVPKTNTVDGGVPSTVLGSFPGDQPIDFVLVGSTFYVGAGISNTIWTLPITGGTPTPLWSTNVPGAPYDLASDGTSLYWTDFDEGYLYVIPLAGPYAQQMSIVISGEPALILVDANNVYFTSNFGDYWSLPIGYRP